MTAGSFHAYPSLYLNKVAETRSGAYLVTSARGRKNFKGRLLKSDDTFSDELYVVPIMSVTNVRDQTDSEREHQAVLDAVAINVRIGSIVRCETGKKYYPDTDKFVVFKTSPDGTTFNLVPVGGDPTGRYLRVSANQVTVVDLV